MGYSEIKYDSIHSKNNTGQKDPCYVPQGWAKVIQSSKQNQATYVVKSTLYDNSHDFEVLLNLVVSKIPYSNM
jgi:hypothetical protein